MGKGAAPLALNPVARIELFGQALYYGSAGMGWEVEIVREAGSGCRTGFGSGCGLGIMGWMGGQGWGQWAWGLGGEHEPNSRFCENDLL